MNVINPNLLASVPPYSTGYRLNFATINETTGAMRAEFSGSYAPSASDAVFYTKYGGVVYYDWYICDGVMNDPEMAEYTEETDAPFKKVGTDRWYQRRILGARLKELAERTSWSYSLSPSSYNNGGAFEQWAGYTIPYIDTSKVINYDRAFCYSNIVALPYMYNGAIYADKPTSTMNRTFCNCNALQAIGKIKTDGLKSSDMVDAFKLCRSLKDITIDGTIKIDSNNFDMSYSPNLTAESMLSIFNSFLDNTGEDTQYSVYFHPTALGRVADKQDIVTNKNILIVSKSS